MRRVVAVGSLDRMWLSVPDDLSIDALQAEFQNHFGAEWTDVLNAADTSFAYHSANNAYFAVQDLSPVENLTLDQLLTRYGNGKPPNILVS